MSESSSKTPRPYIPSDDDLILIQVRLRYLNTISDTDIPRWIEMHKLTYLEDLSPKYNYRLNVLLRDNIIDIYGRDKITNKVEPVGLFFNNRCFLINKKYASAEEITKPFKTCFNDPVRSCGKMDRSCQEVYSQIERVREHVSDTCFRFKEKCYEHDECGKTGTCCCYMFFEILPQVPKMVEVNLPLALETLGILRKLPELPVKKNPTDVNTDVTGVDDNKKNNGGSTEQKRRKTKKRNKEKTKKKTTRKGTRRKDSNQRVIRGTRRGRSSRWIKRPRFRKRTH